jgi:protein-S-isoprenylcysteine O-methyltransferase Ste14
MVKARFEWIEIVWIIFGVLLLSLVLTNPPPPEINFVPSAVTAFTTFAGILTAFIGFWLTHAYSNLKDEETKKWMSKRIKAIVVVVVIGLIFVMMSFNALVYGWLESAHKTALFGTGIILLALVEIMFIIAFREWFEE